MIASTIALSGSTRESLAVNRKCPADPAPCAIKNRESLLGGFIAEPMFGSVFVVTLERSIHQTTRVRCAKLVIVANPVEITRLRLIEPVNPFSQRDGQPSDAALILKLVPVSVTN